MTKLYHSEKHQRFMISYCGSHRVIAASAGLVMLNNCYSIRQRVCLPILANAIASMSRGRCSGARAGRCLMVGLWNVLPILASGLKVTNPALRAQSMTSLIRRVIRLTVSSLPTECAPMNGCAVIFEARCKHLAFLISVFVRSLVCLATMALHKNLHSVRHIGLQVIV